MPVCGMSRQRGDTGAGTRLHLTKVEDLRLQFGIERSYPWERFARSHCDVADKEREREREGRHTLEPMSERADHPREEAVHGIPGKPGALICNKYPHRSDNDDLIRPDTPPHDTFN